MHKYTNNPESHYEEYNNGHPNIAYKEGYVRDVAKNNFMNTGKLPQNTGINNFEEEEGLENLDTVGNIETAKENEEELNHYTSQNTNLQHIKDKFGDVIDSSGGTIDAVDVLQNDVGQVPVPEIHNISSLQDNHYSSTNVLVFGSKEEPNYCTIEDDSAQKTKQRLKELTKLTGEK